MLFDNATMGLLGSDGGARKVEAIRAACRGGWVNVLITDLEMAQRLTK